MMSVEERFVKLLLDSRLKVATAESCTGGLISEMITRVPGSSQVFECGICSYSNDIKMKILGVKKDTIDTFTEVSPQCAEEMARGVRLLSGADIGISTTGYAGPGGGTAKDPVGTIYMGISTSYKTYAYKTNFCGLGLTDRIDIRKKCAETLLEHIIFNSTVKYPTDPNS